MRKMLILAACLFVAPVLTGCGNPEVITIQGPMDVSSYSKIYVADADLTSTEQNEDARIANAKFSRLIKSRIISAVQQKSRFSVLQNATSPSDSLKIETKVHITYGNRALRYFVGYGAGSGSIVINMKLKDVSSGEIKLEMQSESLLSIGFFGGDMEKVVEKAVNEIVTQFGANL